ncbi:unnamed protein product, partial [Prorocentrum cordatum]
RRSRRCLRRRSPPSTGCPRRRLRRRSWRRSVAWLTPASRRCSPCSRRPPCHLCLPGK